MNNRTISVVGLASGLCAVASVLFFGIALGFDSGAGSNLVERLTATAPSDAEFVRWGAVADMLGYYLLPAVVMVAARTRLAWTTSVPGDLAMVAGVAYATIGAIGAAMLAAAAPPLIESGAPESRLALETLARSVEGLWQWLEALPFGLWATGVALALRRSRPPFAALFGALAVGAVLVWTGRLSGSDPVLVAGLVLWLGPFPVAIATVRTWSP